MPREAFSGDSITVQWTVTNLGTAPTDVNHWADAVFLSPDSVLNFDYQLHPPNTVLFRDPQFASIPHSGTLAASSSYSASARFALPRQNHGKYWLYVYADMRTRIPELENKAKERGDVYEHVYDFNNTTEDTLSITLSPLSDLIVTSITSSDSASTNQPVTVSWRVQNVGLAPTFESLWSDQVFISKSPTFQANSAQAIASFDHSGILLRDASYVGNGTVTIPSGYAGPAYFYVKTDWRNQVVEYSDTAGVDTGNVNRNGRRVTVLPPDLFTTNVTIPETGSSGTTTTVQWTVRNLGPGTLVNGTWSDRVYLSRLAAFNADSAIVVGSFTRSGTLKKDSTYTTSGEVRLPNGIQGPFYVYVKADWANQIFENNVEGNNLGRSDATFQINLSPWPDLQPTITSVLTNAFAGQQVQMTWQVRNAGTAPTQPTSWIDRLYLSTQTTLDSATVVGNVVHTGTLVPNSSYTAAFLVTLPADLRTAAYYLFVKTDADDAAFEHTDEGNNIARSNAIPVSAYPPVDLRVKTISVSNSGQSGLPLALNVTVENIGTGKTLASSWTDAVYLSPDSVLNENLDIRLLRIGHTGALNGGQSYTLSPSVLLPNGSAGTYYMLVKTDADNQVNDISRSNNVRSSSPVAITLSPSADLVVDSFTAPTRSTAGQPITLRWRIGNHGNGRTNSPTWYEAVYLSADSVIDKSDTKLGTYRRDGGLDAASSYADTMRVELPAYVAGPHFLILKADNNDDVYEHNAENNNTRAKLDTLLLAPAADLIVTKVAVPGSAVPGEPVTVSWTIRNIGSNPAVGWLRDAVYISADTKWEVTDPLVGVDYRFINLAPRAFQVISKRVNLADAMMADSIGNVISPLPGVTPGTYRVIVRTNIRNNIREVTLANNALASQDTVGIDLPTLVPGIPSTGTLVEGQMRYFKINVAANLDLQLRFTSNVNDASNEMYVAYNRVPTFNDYDVAGTTPLSAGQEITVASTRQGTYYILLFSRAASAMQTFSLTATLLSFSISEVTPDHGGTGGQVTSTVYGAGFRDSTRFVLKTGSSQLVQGKLLRLVNSTQAKVRWDLAGAPLGTYDVMAINSDSSIAVRAGGFAVETLRAGQLVRHIDGPSLLRRGSVATYTVRFTNESNVDIAYIPITLAVRGNARIEGISWTDGIFNLASLGRADSCVGCNDYLAVIDSSDGSQYTLATFLAKDVPALYQHQITLHVRTLASDTLGIYTLYRVLDRNDFMDAFFAAAAEARNQILGSGAPDSLRSIAVDSTTFVEFVLRSFSAIGLIELGGGMQPMSKWTRPFIPSILLQNSETNLDIDCFACRKFVGKFCKLLLAAGDIKCGSLCSGLIVLGGGPAVICWVSCTVGSWLVCQISKESICESVCTPTVRPVDPNDITGPPGFGTQGWVQRTQEMPYTIRFENDPLLATAPAQTVNITQTLDTTIDIRTFRLGAFGFGSFVFNPPANVAHYSSRLDVRDSLGVFVDVVAGVDVPANKIFWTFRSIDPVTGLPPANPLAGFLPVEDSFGHGQGFVNYTIRPKSTTQTGDIINAQASIVFDVNNPIVTPSIFNTIDADVPVSSMIPPAIRITETSYRLRWAGTDLGSGIAGYTIYASHQDSAFVPWLSNTADTSAIFIGIQGDRYRFYSIATDGAGNVGVPSEPLVITGVEEKQMPPRVFALSNNYPNPFNPLTAINYDVPRKSLVTIKIYNVFGQEVYTLVNEQKDAGRYTATWNGINNQNLAVTSGVYLIRMRAADFVQVKKMTVLK